MKTIDIEFKCQGCGNCCEGFPGYVWLSSKEIIEIASFLKITEAEFLKKYCREKDGKISLKELSLNFACIFLNDKRCQIYSVRPNQCKTFPFWEGSSLEELEKFCPGIKRKR